jgi:hypothetical protein
MLEYERSSEELLVAFDRSIAVLDVQQESSMDTVPYKRLDCKDHIGGVGFLHSDGGGTKHLVTLRKTQQL